MSIKLEEGISHMRIVQSIDAVTSHLESGLKHASVNRALCPLKRRTILLVSRSSNIIVKSSNAMAIRELSL